MPRSRRFPLLCAVCAAALAGFAPAPAGAMHAVGQADPAPLQTTIATTGALVSFTLGASVGVIEGGATELAFDYPYGRKFKLSELTWDIKDVAMAGVRGSVGVGRRFRLNAGVWSALTEGGGMMVDRDWNYPDGVGAMLVPDSSNWTDESRHPDTSLDEGTIVDVNVSVLALQAGSFSLRGIAGYKNDTWSWSSRGGTFLYSTEYGLSRDYAGAFPEGQRVITYEQQYSIPYFGLGASWTRPAFQVESHLLFSPVVSALDSDYHALRGVYFEGRFSGGTYVGFGMNATWVFGPRWCATLGAEYQWIPEMTGDVTVTGDEGTGFYGGGGGIAMNATSVTLGAGYRF